MKKIMIFLFAVMAMALFIGASLQPDTAVVELILVTGVAGFSVSALTQVLKRFIEKTFRFEEKWLGLVVSLIASAAATAIYLIGTGWSTLLFFIYSILVWAVANGFFKITHPEKD